MNELDDFKIRLQRGPWGGGYDIMVMKKPRDSNNMLIIDSVEIISVEPGCIIEPLFSLNRTDTQVLMDDLWDAGVRPSEGSGSAGALKATQNHLEDMRTIALDAIKRI